ncbi:hypothetical protein GQ42DRAFT_179269 [Ramicandelaber brevisporus]|nr:hypothetical protein GQ42DRAFT_179269 [Ramicandelaber brevisporus]
MTATTTTAPETQSIEDFLLSLDTTALAGGGSTATGGIVSSDASTDPFGSTDLGTLFAGSGFSSLLPGLDLFNTSASTASTSGNTAVTSTTTTTTTTTTNTTTTASAASANANKVGSEATLGLPPSQFTLSPFETSFAPDSAILEPSASTQPLNLPPLLDLFGDFDIAFPQPSLSAAPHQPRPFPATAASTNVDAALAASEFTTPIIKAEFPSAGSNEAVAFVSAAEIATPYSFENILSDAEGDEENGEEEYLVQQRSTKSHKSTAVKRARASAMVTTQPSSPPRGRRGRASQQQAAPATSIKPRTTKTGARKATIVSAPLSPPMDDVSDSDGEHTDATSHTAASYNKDKPESMLHSYARENGIDLGKMSKTEQRMLRNKISAQNFRNRRKAQMSNLSDTVEQLRAEIEQLKTETTKKDGALAKAEKEKREMRQQLQEMRAALERYQKQQPSNTLSASVLPPLMSSSPRPSTPFAAAAAVGGGVSTSASLTSPTASPRFNPRKDLSIASARRGGKPPSAVPAAPTYLNVHSVQIPETHLPESLFSASKKSALENEADDLADVFSTLDIVDTDFAESSDDDFEQGLAALLQYSDAFETFVQVFDLLCSAINIQMLQPLLMSQIAATPTHSAPSY